MTTIKKLKLLFLALFVIIYGAVFSASEYYKNIEIRDELDQRSSDLKLSFDITYYHNFQDAKAIERFFKSRKEIISLFAKARDADKETRDRLRKELYKKLANQFRAMQDKGIKVLLFSFEDNSVFLRVHKPDKYGDSLTDVRHSIKLTNKTHKTQRGFEQGKVTHGFRNVFPVFGEDKRYVGSIDISYSSDNIQNVISNIHKVHTHFLVKTSVFDSKVWKLKGMSEKYHESVENPDYMLTLGVEDSHPKVKSTKRIIDNYKEYIIKSMSESKQFSVYESNGDHADIISFVPINNLKHETVAYLVSYTSSEHIVDIESFFAIINTLMFITLIIGLYFIYRQLLVKKMMQREIDVKTQELQNVNVMLEEKILKRTAEQNQLLSLFNKGDVSLLRWKNNDDRTIEYASNNTKSIFGYTKEEFLNENIKYINIIHKDDLFRVRSEASEALKKGLDFFRHEPYRVITKESKIIWVMDNILIIKDTEGRATHFLGYISDITEMKNNELEMRAMKDRFQLAIDGSNDGLWDWNTSTDKMYFSSRLTSMLGYKDGEIAHNLSALQEIMHPDDMEEVFKNVEKHLSAKTKVFEHVHRMKHKNGSWIWILSRGKALFDFRGEATRMVGFNTDISRNKELEENLQQLVEEKTAENIKQGEVLQQQSKMAAMGEMIGAIAHQWRQPLNVLSINIQNLEYDYEEKLINEKFVHDFIEKNSKTIEFMSRTIDDFRNF
ncbi:MAG: PAS domain-containing protein, partial [Sulfurimonas sp.]|nr:PAS domain-containing protein [Sulfurimonas sp.]